MFWIALVAIVFGGIFTKFGAMSVTLFYQLIALKIVSVTLLVVCGLLAWRWRRNEGGKSCCE